ncbi:MAG TPA: tetratricopeptide repeat protein, partial [Terriglobales bacterium]|nr:tetratricopeptide repeat protein [Terriglobales bacterium]
MSRRICLFLLIALSAAASADTIRLKNGTFLTVDKVRDKGDSYEYVMGGGTYTIAKKFVERVESGGGPSISIGSAVPTTQVISDPNTGIATLPPPPSAGGEGKHGKLPVTVPAGGGPSSADESTLMQQIITAGHVDPQGLAAIDKKGNKHLSAMAYFLASRFEMEHNEFETARAYMEQALQFTPDSVPLMEHYVVTLADTGRYAEALQQAEHATQVAPNDALAHVLLGIVDYNSDRNADAIRAWKRALELQPDNPMTKQLLAKAEREQKAESHFSQRESRHFTLHYEGAQTSLLLP